MLDEYQNLPEYLEQHWIEEHLVRLTQAPCGSDLDILEAIYELSARQADNYSKINDSLYRTVSDFILCKWDKRSAESTETCLCIIINLELQEAYERIINDKSIVNKAVINEIKDTIEDVGLDVRNNRSQS